MSDEVTLAPFQQAAVDLIVRQLTDANGPRRFLLADEVGLGKTIVAHGVIASLAKALRKKSPTIVYLCSNGEIAEQNREKLVANQCHGGEECRPQRRITDLVLRGCVCQEATAAPKLYAFTPGTSLSRGTGTVRERQLLLYLLSVATDRNVFTRAWRDFFRATAGGSWDSSFFKSALRRQFAAHVDHERVAAVTAALQKRTCTLVEELERAVAGYADGSVPVKKRNSLLADLRQLVQRATLVSLKPDLVLLDEVQRFRDVLDVLDTPDGLAAVLIRPGVRVLILSATPYRMLTLAHEVNGTQHYEDFFATLRFLLHNDPACVLRIAEHLDRYGKRLKDVPLDGPRDPQLLELKRQLESDLRRVICRTERSWFYENAFGALRECIRNASAVPGQDELHDFFALHRTLGRHLSGAGQVTDYWKSTPSMITFVDNQYKLGKVLQDKPIPRRLLSAPDNPALLERNHRLQALVADTLGGAGQRPVLWVKPTFQYHEDVGYGESSPRKMLVFSGWRFVPKAISVMVSAEAARRLIPRSGSSKRVPLPMPKSISPQLLNVCLPSRALAGLATPASFATGGSLRPFGVLVAETEKAVRKQLAEVGVAIKRGSRTTHWEAVMRLEARRGYADDLREALRRWKGSGEDHDVVATYRRRIVEWLSSEKPLWISPRELRRITWLVLASPSVALVRALIATYGQDEVRRHFARVWEVCFGALRRYMNRPVVEAAVKRHPSLTKRSMLWSRRNYGDHVLVYCADHHFQAMLDEHVFLLRTGMSGAHLPNALRHLEGVWSLSQGSRRTNRAKGAGARVRIDQVKDAYATHFALAFGEELEDRAASTAGEKLRKSDIRDAFNSPFWPFVLVTTSVGQEGLDFHYHCRDVFHWNLPSNPVDLEQREGRVSRRNGLAVRASIAQEWQLQQLGLEALQSGKNPWTLLYERLDDHPTSQRYKQGLYPHWIYECADPTRSVGVQRHVAFFQVSRDAQRYARLKSNLALYRLVFGQTNQEDLLKALTRRLDHAGSDQARVQAHRTLRSYMLSLSPVTRDVALAMARREAAYLLKEGKVAELQRLLRDISKLIDERPEVFAGVRPRVEQMRYRLRDALSNPGMASGTVVDIVAAFSYLRNPFDGSFDAYADGFLDDIEVLEQVDLS